MKKLKVTGTATAMPTGILLGVVLCLVITLVAACLLAWLVNGGRLGMESLGYVICGTQLASSLIGTCVAAACAFLWRSIHRGRGDWAHDIVGKC